MTDESLNAISLNGGLLTALYGESLVLLADKPNKKSSPDPHSAGPSEMPGKNRKNITLLVDFSPTDVLPAGQLDFIKRMLEACKLSIEDVALINYGSTALTIEQIKAAYRPVSMLLFGVDPASIGLPMRFPEFKLQHYDGTTFLSLPPIDQFTPATENGKILKGKLWACLRTLFNV